MLYISLSLFLISLGSLFMYRNKNPNLLHIETNAQINIFALGYLLNTIMLFITISYLWHLKWYWNILIFLGLILFLAIQFAKIYSFVFGVKTREKNIFSPNWGSKVNRHKTDALITFILGLILFLISIL